MTEKMQMPYANLQMSADFVICYIPEDLKDRVSVKKIKKTQEIISKSDNTPSWEREEGKNLLLFLHGFSG